MRRPPRDRAHLERSRSTFRARVVQGAAARRRSHLSCRAAHDELACHEKTQPVGRGQCPVEGDFFQSGWRLKFDHNVVQRDPGHCRSEEHTSELQSLMRISYAVFCLKKKKKSRKYTTQLIT